MPAETLADGSLVEAASEKVLPLWVVDEITGVQKHPVGPAHMHGVLYTLH